MYNVYKTYPCPYYVNMPMRFDNMYNVDPLYPYPYLGDTPKYIQLKDYGLEPFVVNIEEVTKRNNTFRTALWTGCHLQLALMSIKASWRWHRLGGSSSPGSIHTD